MDWHQPLAIDDRAYLSFAREEWRQFAEDQPLTLDEATLKGLRGFNERIALPEVADFYVPLARLIHLYFLASQRLYRVTSQFLGHDEPKVPYIIGIAGSVAVGKSTSSRILQALLAKLPEDLAVAWISTDNFLYPNQVLEKRGLMQRKGFPESFDTSALLSFLHQVKSGVQHLTTPVYSHQYYDILPGEETHIQQPDILLVEGLNVLQRDDAAILSKPGRFVSDFFDFSIFVDAELASIRTWYLQRFMAFREQAACDSALYFHRFYTMPEDEAYRYAKMIWETINEANLQQNILPYKHRAHLVIKKSHDHSIEQVSLRKL